MMDWTPEKIAELTRLWMVEKLSISQCGKAMGITRNSAMGKIHRLNLPVRIGTLSERAPSHPKPLPSKVEPMPQESTTPVPEPPRGPVKLIDATSRTCRWPLWGETDGFSSDFPVCGADRVPGLAWCSEHVKRAFQTPRRSA